MGKRLPKILHVITRLILGGAQENTLATIAGLSGRGRDVYLVTGPPIGPEGSLMEEAEKLGVKVILIPEMRREINPFLDLVSFLKLYFIMLRWKFGIVHTHSSKAGILGRLAAKLAGVRVVVHTIHGLPFHPYQNKLLNFSYVMLERIAGVFTDRIITVCEAMKEKAISAGIGPRGKFVTIYSGMNLTPFLEVEGDVSEKRRELGIKNGEMVIGKIGRFFPLKGHEYLIKAAPGVVKAFPNVKFLLVGDGILRDKLLAEIRKLRLEDKFVFTGLVSRDDIPLLISVMDILVHTSVREGLARVLPQAIACRKPVISFDIDGAGEVVIPGETGLLVPPENVGALSKAIIDVLSDTERLKKMGKRGYKLVDPAFRTETMVDRIDNLYQQLLRDVGNIS